MKPARPYLIDKIVTARYEARLTQTTLAKAMNDLGFNWSRQTVVDMERPARTGRRASRQPSIDELFALSLLYEKPVKWFIEEWLNDEPFDLDYQLPAPERPRMRTHRDKENNNG